MELNGTSIVSENNILKCDCSNCQLGLNSNGSLVGHFCSVQDCKQIFNTVPRLQNHEVCHQRNAFACTWTDCSQTFAFKEILKLHLRMHASTQCFKCRECNVNFNKKSDLEEHLADHRPKMFGCTWPDCNRSFAFNEILTLHIHLHMGDREILKCKVCDMEFYENFQLEVHLIEHSAVKQQKSFSCTWPNCGQRFAFSDVLHLHLRMHAGDTIFLCKLCDMEFYSDDYLTKHKKHHLNNTYDKPSEMENNELLSDKSDNTLAMKHPEHTNVNDNPKFNNLKQEARRNKRMHLIRSANLIKRQYTNRFRYFCICSNCSNNKHDPNGPKQHICDYIGCGKLFSAPSLLINHARVHSEERKFVCDFVNCGNTFRTANALRWHRRFKKHFKIHDDLVETFPDGQSSRIRGNRHQILCLSSNCLNGNLDTNAPKRHVCDAAGCSRQFSAPSLLLLHERVVHGEKYSKSFTAKLMQGLTDDELNSERYSEVHSDSNSYTRDLNDSASSSKIIEGPDSKSDMKRKKTKKFTCGWKNCTKSFTRNWTLRLHCKTEHGTTCLKCWKSFNDIESLNIHRAEFHNKTPIIRSNSLPVKTESNTPKQDFCNFKGCDKLFSSPELLLVHKQAHTDTQPVSNNFINRIEYANKENVQPARQFAETPYKCRECDFKCTWLYDLSAHQKTHNKIISETQTKFICTFKNCGRSFQTAFDLNWHCHFAKHNPLPYFADEKGRFVCNWGNCTRSYKWKSGLSNHRKFEHGYKIMSKRLNPATSIKYVCCTCPICANGTQASNNLPEMHICDFNECGNIFSTPALLLIHKRIHIEDGPFKCKFDNCTYSFKTNSLLERHHCLPHNNENRYSCLCGFNCKWLYQLWNHLKLHELTKKNGCVPQDSIANKTTDEYLRDRNGTSGTNSTMCNTTENTARSWHQIVENNDTSVFKCDTENCTKSCEWHRTNSHAAAKSVSAAACDMHVSTSTEVPEQEILLNDLMQFLNENIN